MIQPNVFTARWGFVCRVDGDRYEPMTPEEARAALQRWARRVVEHQAAGRIAMAVIAASITLEITEAMRAAEHQLAHPKAA